MSAVSAYLLEIVFPGTNRLCCLHRCVRIIVQTASRTSSFDTYIDFLRSALVILQFLDSSYIMLFPASHLCLLLATAIPATARSTYKPQINWVECAKNVPDPSVSPYFDASTLDLANLPSTLHCGQLDVPMDYTKSFSETNKITLGLAMHRSATFLVLSVTSSKRRSLFMY
jgi:hypothetical protein